MALADVLSAMRSIILDTPALSSDELERRSQYRALFSGLSDHELIDLAKIDPSKFTIYTTSIFIGERNLLRDNFPLTIKLLERSWPVEFGGAFDLFQFVKELHRRRPWRSTDTVVLGENFRLCITEDLTALRRHEPALPDAALFELRIREIKKWPDDPIEARDSLTPGDLATRTVDGLVALEYVIPSCVRFEMFSYDLRTARRAVVNGEAPAETFKEQESALAGARDRDQYVTWLSLAPEIHDLLAAQPRAAKQPLYAVAECLADKNPALSEHDLFEKFLELTVALINNGVIVLLEP